MSRKLEDKNEGKVEDGFTDPELIIPSDIKYGKKRLTAKYLENEVYNSSLDRTIVYYGSKVYMHCPTLYLYKGTTPVTLKAKLFTRNKKVQRGRAKFKINYKTVSPTDLYVTGGLLEETVDYKATKNRPYQCTYSGDITTGISHADAEGNIIIVTTTKTKLIVEVTDIICAQQYETTKLIARIYHLENNGTILDNVPQGGLVKFYIDGRHVGTSDNISYSGFSSIQYVATDTVGCHEITAEYTPNTDELRLLYDTMSGSGTLFIGNDSNKPIITQLSDHRGANGTTVSLNFDSNRYLNGDIQIYLDNQIVPDICTEGQKETVQNIVDFNVNIIIPEEPTSQKSWAFGGPHNFILLYTTTDGYEYWYYTFDDFWILLKTEIMIDSETNDWDNLNIYKFEDNELVTVIPRTDSNIVIGDFIDFIVKIIQEKKLLKDGTIEVEIFTRKDN